MKILIIGGTGLISTGITPLLLARGDEVTLYNRGLHEQQFPGSPRHIHGDRTAYATFEAQMAEAGPFDCVIDMVCFKPEEAESAIRAFRGRVGQYIFCSTVDVYTKPAGRYPIREQEARRPSPAFPYAWNKARCEEILFGAHARGALNVTAIRPAHTYGEGGRLLHTLGFGSYFLDRIRKGQAIICHGDGSSLWASCHRDDVARAFVGAVGNPVTYGQGYHVTSEEWLPWDRYYQCLAEALGAPPPELVHIPTDLLVRVAPKAAEWCAVNFCYNNIFDNTAARRDLGFRHTIPFVEGARRALTWLEEHGQIEDSAAYPFYDRIVAAWKRLGTRMAEELADLEE